MAETNYSAPAASKLLDILELLVTAENGLSLSEIARQLSISLNSAFRICRVMEEREYLLRDHSSGKLMLTSKLYALGARLAGRIDILAQAQAQLQQLMDATGENAHLCVLRDDRLLLLGQVITSHPVRVVVETGSLLYPHASAFGKAIVAHLSPEEQLRLQSITWPKLTPYTVTDPKKMAEEWEEVRLRGVAYDLEEYQIGVRCIGAPIFSSTGEVVAGIGIMGPSYRLTPEIMEGIELLVRDAAAHVSSALGAERLSDDTLVSVR